MKIKHGNNNEVESHCRKEFDQYLSLNTEGGWLQEITIMEYYALINFLKEIKSNVFFCAVIFDEISILEIPVISTYTEYIEKYTLVKYSKDKKLQVVFYDESKRWIAFSKGSQSSYVIGLDKEIADIFKQHFKCFI